MHIIKSNPSMKVKDQNLKRMTEISSISENKHILRIIINQIIEISLMIKAEIDMLESQNMRNSKIKE